MQSIAPQIDTTAPNVIGEVVCVTHGEDGNFFVTIVTSLGRRNYVSKAEVRKLCLEQGFNFEEAWEGISTHPEMDFGDPVQLKLLSKKG